MRRPIMRVVACAAAVALWGVADARGQTTFNVAAGFDLFQTTAGTQFDFGGGPVPLVGVPLGSFDFDNLLGRNLGVQNVGSTTDTIIERTSAAIPAVPGAGSSANINLTMLALQLETATPINIGLGLHNYFITLQSARGGPATMGNMTITWNADGLSGTFSSFFDVFFDIRQDGLSGPIITSSDLTLTSSDTPWSFSPPAGAEQIPGVNIYLATYPSTSTHDRSQDFWPETTLPPPPYGPTTDPPYPGQVTKPFTEGHPGTPNLHVSQDAMVPEPASFALLGLGVVGLAVRHRVRRRAA
jgi:hypothetical protein